MQPPWFLVCFYYFLAFFIPGALIQLLAFRRLRPRYLLILIGPCTLGSVLLTFWDFVIKPFLS